MIAAPPATPAPAFAVAAGLEVVVACECLGIDGERRDHDAGGCTLTGEWVARSACCTQAIVLCSPCLAEEERHAAGIVARQETDRYSCRTCGAPFALGTTRRL